jgi:hypothetical protein
MSWLGSASWEWARSVMLESQRGPINTMKTPLDHPLDLIAFNQLVPGSRSTTSRKTFPTPK